MHVSIGDICTSRLYLSLQTKRTGWGLYWGPTYNGTTHGLVMLLGAVTVLAHRRALDQAAGDE